MKWALSVSVPALPLGGAPVCIEVEGAWSLLIY